MIQNRKFQGFKMFLLMRNLHFLYVWGRKNILDYNYFSVAISISIVFFWWGFLFSADCFEDLDDSMIVSTFRF